MPADPAPTHSLKDLNAMLAADMETVCRHYLPNGKRNGNYWQVGSTAGEEGASLRIALAGRWRGYWRDWANPKDRGSPLDLIRAVRNHASIGEAAAEARRYLALPAYERPRCSPGRPAGAPEAQKGLERVLEGAAPIRPDDPAGRYLASRGLAIEDARAAGLRFRPDTWVQVDGEKCELPALLAPIRAQGGALEGLQRIFLAPDGSKAPIPDPKRTSGRLFSGAVRWPAPGATRMVLTEGIEDALAVMRALGAGRPHDIAVAAAISAGRVHRVGLPPDIRRVTLVQDRDMAGEQAWVGRHHPRVSGLGYDAFAGLGRSMQRRWRETLRADDARLAAEAEKQARTRSRSEAMESDWTELRSRAGPEPLALLGDPEHAGLLRRTVEFAQDREIDRDTARSWRAFLDGHYTAVGAELTQAWVKAAPLRRDAGGPLSPENVSGYRRLMRQASAFAAALDSGAALPGDRKAERTLWRRRIGSAPAYLDIAIRFVEQFGAEEALMRRREERLPGSTLPTGRLADHMATLNGAAALDGLDDNSRKKIRRLVRQHQAARKEAGVTRTDAPWPTDGQIERRIETGRQLREGWRALNEAKRDDPLGALDHHDHMWLVDLAARHAADPSLDADTARRQATYLARHFQELDAALEKTRSAARMPNASPGWRYADFRQYHRLRMHAASFTVTLPDDLPVPGVPRDKWQGWLDATPNSKEASDMFVQSILAEDAAIRERETLLPGEALPSRRLHEHMETLKAATEITAIPEVRDRDERHMLLKRLRAWTEAREGAGVTRTDVGWRSDRGAALRAEHLALDKAWNEIKPYFVPDQASLLDRPDHRDLVARTVAFVAELKDWEDLAQKWRDRFRSHLNGLKWHLNDTFGSVAGSRDRSARNAAQLDRYLRLPWRVDAFADMLAALPPAMTQFFDFDLPDWKLRMAEAPSRNDVYRRFYDDLSEEERIVTEREAGLPGSTLPTRRLAEHMAVLELLASHEMLPDADREYYRDLLDAHRQARADAGVTVANLPWPDTPELQAAYEYRRIRDAVERARAAAGDGSIVYEPGIGDLGAEAARLLATSWLSADGRRYLEKFQTDFESGTDNRDTVRSAIERARALLREYPPILERALAPKPPAPDEPASRPGLFGRVRRLFGDEDDIPARRPAEPAPQALNDFDSDYRWWDVRAEQFVKKFQTWRAADNAAQRDHVDRRWIDMADLIAEFEAIRSAARDPKAKPYRIETPDAGAFEAADQRHDPDRLATLLRDVIRPEDERSSEAVLELARRNRAWPDETLGVFRRHARQAAAAGETRSLSRLAAGLPRNLTRSLTNLSEVTWQHQGEDIDRRREREQGYDRSM